MPVHDMGGERDYRWVEKTSSELFFHPVNSDTDARMNDAFRALCGSVEEHEYELPIAEEKRMLRIPIVGVDASGNKIARFSFQDLCGRAMGRADYSLISEHFGVVFVDRVPKFTADLGAEFRRFVSFTDIMYGKKTILRLQSDAPTQELFPLEKNDIELDELWAFRRCSSMLSEMQSPKYSHMVGLFRKSLMQQSAIKL